MVKVNINQVKPQITYIKRIVSKHLISNKLQKLGINPITGKPYHTKTKPHSIKLTTTQYNTVQNIINTNIKNLLVKYPHTTKPQITYIKNHFNTHTSKFLN